MTKAELQKLIGTDKIVIGSKKTMKLLREAKIKEVFISSNCPADSLADLEYYKKFADINIKPLKERNDELGVICKKQYSVSMIGLLK